MSTVYATYGVTTLELDLCCAVAAGVLYWLVEERRGVVGGAGARGGSVRV
jgi:hypothetical protein